MKTVLWSSITGSISERTVTAKWDGTSVRIWSLKVRRIANKTAYFCTIISYKLTIDRNSCNLVSLFWNPDAVHSVMVDGPNSVHRRYTRGQNVACPQDEGRIQNEGQQNLIQICCEALQWMGRLLYSWAWRRQVWYNLTDVWEVTAAFIFIIWLEDYLHRNNNCLAFSFNRKNWQEWISTDTLCLL